MSEENHRTIGAIAGLISGMILMNVLGISGMLAGAIFGAGGAVLGGMSGEQWYRWRRRG